MNFRTTTIILFFLSLYIHINAYDELDNKYSNSFNGRKLLRKLPLRRANHKEVAAKLKNIQNEINTNIKSNKKKDQTRNNKMEEPAIIRRNLDDNEVNEKIYIDKIETKNVSDETTNENGFMNGRKTIDIVLDFNIDLHRKNLLEPNDDYNPDVYKQNSYESKESVYDDSYLAKLKKPKKINKKIHIMEYNEDSSRRNLNENDENLERNAEMEEFDSDLINKNNIPNYQRNFVYDEDEPTYSINRNMNMKNRKMNTFVDVDAYNNAKNKYPSYRRQLENDISYNGIGRKYGVDTYQDENMNQYPKMRRQYFMAKSKMAPARKIFDNVDYNIENNYDDNIDKKTC